MLFLNLPNIYCIVVLGLIHLVASPAMDSFKKFLSGIFNKEQMVHSALDSKKSVWLRLKKVDYENDIPPLK